MNDLDENKRRIQRRIATARVKHMSNAKWRKVFATIHSFSTGFGDLGIKFINDDRLFTGQMPGPDFEYDDNFGECGGASYAPFSHIEFLQLPNQYRRELDGPRYPATEFTNDLKSLIERLGEVGAFAIQAYDGGIRILGYEWDADNSSS